MCCITYIIFINNNNNNKKNLILQRRVHVYSDHDGQKKNTLIIVLNCFRHIQDECMDQAYALIIKLLSE